MKGTVVLTAGFLLLAGAAPAGATHLPDDLRCGSLSPFGNACDGAAPQLLSNDFVGYVDTTGYVGHLTIWLNHTFPGLGGLRWECDAVGPPPPAPLPSPVTSCIGPFAHGAVILWLPVTLHCEATASLYAGIVPLGPAGMWRCIVDM
ncbi:MAG TPA: hypothetical protein VGR28_09780 [Candidatus Thermoplasmatota archaeon]|jgi:hypothetical protein|nr:hypothetical protein [Candidatus Thermoplasmatota archaeon]